MKKIFVFTLLLTFISCQQTETNQELVNSKKQFEINVASFKAKFLEGFAKEDLELQMSIFADSVKWTSPSAGGELLGYEDLKKAAKDYHDNFDMITYTNAMYFGSPIFNSQNDNLGMADPNYVRTGGVWTNVHTESNKSLKLKWMAVMWFNKDGQIHQMTDFMDVSSIPQQIAD